MEEKINKEAQSTSSTQPEYVDESGKVFTSSDIVSKGFKPKGRFKGHSLSDRVGKADFGKVK